MNPNNRAIRRHLQCINCNIVVDTLRRFVVMELDTKVVSLISNWIAPVLITENDYICEACWDIAMHTVNEALALNNSGEQQATGSSHQGHRQVCVLCGLSILRRRSDLILKENASGLDSNITNIIESRIAPRQITSTDRVCHRCWQRCRRTAVRTQQIEDARSVYPDGNVLEEPNLTDQGVEQNIKAEEDIADIPIDSVAADQPAAEIVLPNYRRAANTASHCLFFGCTNIHLRIISDSLRATVLSNNKFYIPALARVCQEHLFSNNWDSLYDLPNSISTFNQQQIEHVFSFVNSSKSYLNLSSIEAIQDIDENLFFYWIGRSKEEFISLLNQVPRIKEAHRGVLGLAALLMKLRTKESDVRLSKLLGVPRRTLERLMHSIRELLVQDIDIVPNNLGLNRILRENLLQHNL